MNDRKIVELDLNDILPNRFQPRIKFNETSITELAESIKEHGVIQPIVVRPLGDRYEIIAGERRYKASVLAGKETIPAIVTELNDKDSAEVALIENVQRQDLTPIEEAISYKKILDMGYLTQEELAEKLGKTQSTVANKLRLLNLDEEVQEALLETKISERHARSLLKLTNKEQQKAMLAKIIRERLTVRKTDEEIGKMINDNKNMEILDFNEEPKNTGSTNLNIPSTPIVEDVVPEPVMPQMPNSVDVNPGFMNVEKIEQEAKDINVTPKTNVDFNALLKPEENIVPVTNPEPETTDDDSSAEAILKPGKFFNFSDLDNEGTVESTPNGFSDETIMEPLIQTPLVQENVQSEPVNQNFVTNFNQSMVEPQVEKPTPIIPVNPEPLVQTPIMEPMSNQTISVPSYSELDAELYKTPEPVVPAATSNNLKQAIDLIRDCASKLEALGFRIETEEYDFEDMYQTIFKINK